MQPYQYDNKQFQKLVKTTYLPMNYEKKKINKIKGLTKNFQGLENESKNNLNLLQPSGCSI